MFQLRRIGDEAMAPSKYIGITGFKNTDLELRGGMLEGKTDVDLAHSWSTWLPPDYRLMCGVLVNDITARGFMHSNRRYCPFDAIRDCMRALMRKNVMRKSFQGGARILPAIHYDMRARYDLRHELVGMFCNGSREFSLFAGFMDEVVAAKQKIGLQINMPKPDVRALGELKESKYGDHIEIILQINPWSVGDNPSVKDVVAYARKYEGIADHALLDASCGRGVGVDVAFARYVEQEWHLANNMNLGIAGGLDAHRVQWLRGMDVSVDAETGVHGSSGKYLDVQNVWEYVEKASKALGRY